MAAKTAPPASAPATPEPVDAAPATAESAKVAPAWLAWLPLGLTLLLSPALCWGLTQYILLPRLEKKIGALPTVPGPLAPAETAPADEAGAHGRKGEAGTNYEFANMVVNLAGTMGTRYLKTTFLVTSSEAGLHAAFEANKAKLVDVTLNVLASLTLADLEEPGAKNLIREKLVNSYNQVIGRKLAEQVYFSDFVVQ